MGINSSINILSIHAITHCVLKLQYDTLHLTTSVV
jgi:hypothetical protein